MIKKKINYVFKQAIKIILLNKFNQNYKMTKKLIIRNKYNKIHN